MNYISEKSKIGNNLKIGNFNQIEDDVTVGDNVEIGNNVVIKKNTVIGDNVKISDGVIIGGNSPDRKNDGTNMGGVIVGDETIIREHTTIHKSSFNGNFTKIGKNCLIMCYVHISHDTIIEDNVTITNFVQIGGHSIVEKYANIGIGSLIIQRSSIGTISMIGTGSVIRKDVGPYTLVNGSEAKFYNINTIGLKRNLFDNIKIEKINNFYKKLFNFKNTLTENIISINYSNLSEEEKKIYDFVRNSKRGIIRPKY